MIVPDVQHNGKVRNIVFILGAVAAVMTILAMRSQLKHNKLAMEKMRRELDEHKKQTMGDSIKQ